MRRRQFLLASASLSMGVRPAWSAAVLEKNFGTDWRVPKATVLEVWPARVAMDLAGVLGAISEWGIPTDSRVVIRLDDGAHVQTKAIGITHAHGSRLSIIGNIAEPERCKLIWSGPSEGFYVGAGTVLGFINGMVLEQKFIPSRGLGSAFLADEGGVIHCGPNIEVRNFYYGFQARFGGVIACRRTISRGAGDANYFAFNGGHISAHGAQALDARDRANGLGSGFVAEYGGTIDANDAVANYNLLAGFTALSNGVIRAHNAKAQHNGKAGFYTNTGGTIIAHNAIARANCGEGLLSFDRADGISGNQIINEANSVDAKSCLQ
jgi:hypothetical protein